MRENRLWKIESAGLLKYRKEIKMKVSACAVVSWVEF